MPRKAASPILVEVNATLSTAERQRRCHEKALHHECIELTWLPGCGPSVGEFTTPRLQLAMRSLPAQPADYGPSNPWGLRIEIPLMMPLQFRPPEAARASFSICFGEGFRRTTTK